MGRVMKQEKEFFSIKEFAAVIGVHPNTIRRAIKDGRICALRMCSGKNGLYRIPKTEIERLSIDNLVYQKGIVKPYNIDMRG